jgi:hypothetical protein
MISRNTPRKAAKRRADSWVEFDAFGARCKPLFEKWLDVDSDHVRYFKETFSFDVDTNNSKHHLIEAKFGYRDTRDWSAQVATSALKSPTQAPLAKGPQSKTPAPTAPTSIQVPQVFSPKGLAPPDELERGASLRFEYLASGQILVSLWPASTRTFGPREDGLLLCFLPNANRLGQTWRIWVYWKCMLSYMAVTALDGAPRWRDRCLVGLLRTVCLRPIKGHVDYRRAVKGLRWFVAWLATVGLSGWAIVASQNFFKSKTPDPSQTTIGHLESAVCAAGTALQASFAADLAQQHADQLAMTQSQHEDATAIRNAIAALMLSQRHQLGSPRRQSGRLRPERGAPAPPG